MKIKKTLALLLVISMIGYIGSFSASAATMSSSKDNGIIHLDYVNISSVSNELTVNGKVLNVYAGTFGYFDVNKCGVTATLQKLSGSSWTNYRVWTATSPSAHPDYVVIDTSVTVTSGQYRLVSSHSVTVGSDTEFEGMMSPTRTVS